MNKLAIKLLAVMAMLLLIIGCGQESTVETPTAGQGQNTTISVAIDQTKGTIYHKADSLKIAEVTLQYKKTGDSAWITPASDTDGSDGWTFALNLEVGSHYDFEAAALNSDGTLIYTALRNGVEITASDTSVKLVLEQVLDGTVNITSDAFGIVGKAITYESDGTATVTFTLSNPDELGYTYTIKKDENGDYHDDTGDTEVATGSDTNPATNTKTSFAVSGLETGLYVGTVTTESVSIFFNFVISESGSVVLYTAPYIQEPDLSINDDPAFNAVGKWNLALYFFVDQEEAGVNYDYRYEILLGASTIGAVEANPSWLSHPTGKTYNYGLAIQEYTTGVSHFKIQLTVTADYGEGNIAETSRIFRIGKTNEGYVTIDGLMWQDNEAVETTLKPWLTQDNYDACAANGGVSCDDTSGDTAATHCSNLVLGGYNDWRLPTITELETIVDTANRPTLLSEFNYGNSYYYWSSTTSANGTGYAWGVYFGNGNDGWDNRSSSYYVRCVRDGQ